MNLWKGKGGLTRDAELREGRAPFWIATIAVNGARYDGEQQQQVVTTTFVSLVAFGWLAHQLAQMELRQGEEILVEGELGQREVERKDGTTEKKTRVIVHSVTPVRRKMMAPPPPPEPFAEDPPW